MSEAQPPTAAVVGTWRATYTPGSWIVLSGPTSMVVLQPAPARASQLLNSMWDIVVASGSIDELAAELARYNVERMPSFAAFFWGPAGLRSLVRGQVRVQDLGSGEYVADGDGIQTWSEIGLGDLRQVRIDMEGTPEESLDKLQLPLVVGAVAASAVVLDATDAAQVTSPQLAAVRPAPGPVAADDSGPGDGEPTAAAVAAPEVPGGAGAESAPTEAEVAESEVAESEVTEPIAAEAEVAAAEEAAAASVPEVVPVEEPETAPAPESQGPFAAAPVVEPVSAEALEETPAAESVPATPAADPAPTSGEAPAPVPADSVPAAPEAVAPEPAAAAQPASSPFGSSPFDTPSPFGSSTFDPPANHAGEESPDDEDDEADRYQPARAAEPEPAASPFSSFSPFGAPPLPDAGAVAGAAAGAGLAGAGLAGAAAAGGAAAAAAHPGVAASAPSVGVASPATAGGFPFGPPPSSTASAAPSAPAGPAGPPAGEPSAPTTGQFGPPSGGSGAPSAGAWGQPPAAQSNAAPASQPSAPAPGGFGSSGQPQPQFGQPAYGQSPSGQPAYGQSPSGQAGQPAYGQSPSGPSGQPGYGQPAQNPFGPPPGQAPGQAPYGQGGPSGPGQPQFGSQSPTSGPGNPFAPQQPQQQQPQPPQPPQHQPGQPGPWGQPQGYGQQGGGFGGAPQGPPPGQYGPPGGPGGPASQPQHAAEERPTPVAVPQEEVDHDGATVFATGLARALKPSEQPSGSDLVLAAMCNLQHPNEPGSQVCSRCGGQIPPQSPRLVTRPALAILRTSHGERVELDRTVLIGRSPTATRVPREQLPRMLTVPSPSHDISRTHVEITPDGWQIHVKDLYSTNGTTVVRPGADVERERLVPGEPVELRIGWIIDLGDGVTVTLDPPA